MMGKIERKLEAFENRRLKRYLELLMKKLPIGGEKENFGEERARMIGHTLRYT